MKKHNLIIVITFVIAFIITYQALTIAKEFEPEERKAIEISKYFLDAVSLKTGRILFIKHEDKEPNFFWDTALKSDVEWDRLDIWARA